jgi:hypothetical protein
MGGLHEDGDRWKRGLRPTVSRTGAKYQISKTGNGAVAVWSSDGKELLYNQAAMQYVAVSISTQPTFTFCGPVPLTRRFAIFGGRVVRDYDITPDGRFIGVPVTPALDPQSGTLTNPQIQVVLHWFEELK